MDRRLELQELLDSFLPAGSEAYFQPPPNLYINYPCIVYDLDDKNVDHANNVPYRIVRRWSITIIDRDPDSAIQDTLDRQPMCLFNRSFAKDGLNHFVYTMYF